MSTEVDLGMTGRWTEFPDEEAEEEGATAWHIIQTTSLTDGGMYEVETACGITAPWNQTFAESQPANSHEDCIGAAAKNAKEAEREAAKEAKADEEEDQPRAKATTKAK